MNKLLAGIVIGLLAGGAGMWFFLQHHETPAHDAKPEEHKEEGHVQHGTNGETFLKFDQETQRRMGLKTAALEAAQLKPEIKAFGRVVDPAALATVFTDIAAARAQLEASRKEFERLKILHAQNQNVSTRALETAEAAVKRDQIAVDAAGLRFSTTWGKSITEIKDLDPFVRALSTQQAALVRIDLPPGDAGKAPTAARIALLSAPDKPFEAQLLGAANFVDPQTQGLGFLFLVKGGAFAPNAAVTAWLSLPGGTENGVVIPREAIVRHEGEAFVYVQTGDETFERKEIELEHPLAQGWFSDQLKAGGKVVTTGAQQLLSEETKGAE